jgi:hypothetical protein
VSQKGTLSFLINVHFFCLPKRNEPKKRAPEMPTSAKTGACYTGLNGATVLAAVRTISGFALAPILLTSLKVSLLLEFEWT